MVDATRVSSIKIDTGYAGVREYPIFTQIDRKSQIIDDAQFSIILGRNGSGKSTLSRILSIDAKGVKFFDRDNAPLGEDCSNVHVFDESYVVENFRRYPEEHIKPVILLGNFERRRERIGELESKISSVKERIEKIIEECLNRILSKDSLLAKQSFGGSTVWEYVRAYIKNVLSAGDYEIIDFGDGGNMIYYNEDLIVNWMRSGFVRSQDDYALYVSFCFDNARNRILKDVSDNRDILNCSVDEIKEKINHNLKGIDAAIEVIREVDLTEAEEYLATAWWDAAYLLMLLIYKEDKSLFEKIDANIITQQELQIVGICEQNLEQFQEILQKEQEELDKERSEYSSEKVTEYINTLLCMILGGRKMWLESDMDFGYTVHNKYGIIPPSRLSIGEQNILSLCYFFAEMSKGKELWSSMRDNKIIVLDDPISSLDFYNKAGINWMIDYVVKLMSSDGSLSKMIIMTHSLSVAKELEKTIKGRINGRDVRSGGKLKCCDIEDLEKGVLKSRNFSDDDNYRDILLEMYKVAKHEGELASVDLPHFNDVRRVWEAFLKFELGEVQISNRNSVDRVSYFHDRKSAEGKFLESFIIYNYINQGSHSLDSVADYDFDFAPPLSVGESRKYIKQIILFMHMVSPHHIPCRLSRKMDDISEYRDTLNEMYKKEVLKQP